MGDGSTVAFDLKYTPISPITYVYVNEVRKYEGIDFTVSYLDKEITFVDTYADGILINIIYTTDLEKSFVDIVASMIYYTASNQVEVTDFNEGGIVRTILEAVAYELGTGTEETESLYSKLIDVYQSSFVDTAVGEDLENVVALVGVTRRAAVKSTGTVSFGISAPILHDIVIASGVTVSTTQSGTVDAISFTTTAQAILSTGDTEVDAAVIAVNTGTDGNVGSATINIMTTAVSEIETVTNAAETSDGLDIETDDELRARAKRALAAISKATEIAVVANVLNIASVVDCVLDDLSLFEENEDHTHTSYAGTPTFDASNVPLQWVKEITGTRGGGAVTFEQGVDYDITDEATGEVTWASDLLDPDDGTHFYVDYEYYQLGGFNLIVKGEAALSVATLAEVDSVADAIKAAGIAYTYTEPVSKDVDVTVNITVISGYDDATVSSEVESAIIVFLQNLEVGNDVFIAKLYDIIMDVAGVENSSISAPAADVTIYACEYSNDGTITVNV